MPKNRPFAYNPSRDPIPGTDQVGDLAIGVELQNYSARLGGILWWGGADEELGYIICAPVPTMDWPSPLGSIGTVRFWRSAELTNESFLSLVNRLSDGIVTGITEIQSWIDTNEYWTSWNAAEFKILGIDYTSYSLKNGSVFIWGKDISGYSSWQFATPVEISYQTNYCEISSQTNYSYAIDNTGQVWGWGYYSYGSSSSITGNKKTFCKISSGYAHTIAIEYNGQVWGWGQGYDGQLGDNTDDTWQTTPVSIHGNKKTFCQISGGYYNTTIAIQHNGQVWGWGSNDNGQLGNNDVVNRCTPVSIHGNKKTFCKITNGNRRSLGIDKNGQIWSWGLNFVGSIGNNSIVNRCTPVSIHGNKKTFCQISSMAYHNLSLDYKGQIWSWGHNTYGQLGNNSVTNQCTPISIHGNKKTFCQIATGYWHSLAIDQYNNIWSWGLNDYGQLGDNDDKKVLTPESIQGNKKTFCQVSSGNRHTFGTDHTGQGWGWGSDYNAQLGDNSVLLKETPVSLHGNKKTFCQISAGYYQTIGIEYTGQVWGWGNNLGGVLGDNTTTSRRTPVSIHGNKKTFCQIYTDKDGTASTGVEYNGHIWMWGSNANGQLGDNTITSRRTPVSIHGNKKTFCQISIEYSKSIGLEYNGQVWGWGNNFVGGIGDNTTISRYTPVSIHGNKKTFCQIYSMSNNTMGLEYNGQIWTWGYNAFGQLGDNSIESRYTPVSIHGNKKTFCQIAGGFSHGMALDKNGQIWAWGWNGYGNIGNNSIESRRTPVSIHGIKKTFCQIAAGTFASFGIDKDNQLWGWGYDDNRQLGVYHNTKTPIRVCSF